MGLFKNFSEGTRSYSDAHKLIIKNRLWAYVVITGVINIVLFAIVLVVGIYTSKHFTSWLFEFLGISGNEEGFWQTIYSILSVLIKLIVWILFVLCYLSIYKYIVLIVTSPLLAVLADKTHRLITGQKVPYSFSQLSKDVWRGALLVTRNIFIEIFFIILCFFIGYIPILKWAAPVFLFLLSMYFYGFSMMYYAPECYRLKIRKSVRFVRRNNGFAISNGLIFYGVMLIPVVGIIIAPSYAVVAATIGVNKLMKLEAEQKRDKIMEKIFKDKNPVRISAVSYLNTLPFVYGIKQSGFLKNYILNLDVPAVCAKKFETQEADIALVPAGALPYLKNYTLIPDYCIGSNGSVKTVLLLSQVPLPEIRTIYLDEHSLTSVNLAKILALHFWKISPEWINPNPEVQNRLEEMESLVAIGNKTFQLENKFKYIYDLSDEWNKFTGLPFVFACWIRRNDLPLDVLNQFSEAIRWGLENKKKSIETLFNSSEFPGIDIHTYLEKNIDFVFDAEKQKALKLYLDYINNL